MKKISKDDILDYIEILKDNQETLLLLIKTINRLECPHKFNSSECRELNCLNYSICLLVDMVDYNIKKIKIKIKNIK